MVQKRSDMKLDWDTLRIFLAAYRKGSLRAAAEDLGNGHATVRRAIERLEATLGTLLFERSGQGLQLTASGEVLLDNAEAIENQTIEIERRLYGLDDIPKGQINVSIPPSFAGAFFAPFLAKFSLAYPEIDVKVIATNEISNLTRHEADISIRAATFVDDDVVGRRLVDYKIAAYASPDYLEKNGIPEVGNGENVCWIGWGDNDDWVDESPFPNAPVKHVLNEVYLQIEAASAGVGMTWIPAFLGDAEPSISRVPGADVQKGRSLWLLLHSDLRDTARVRAFVDFFAEEIAQQKDRFQK